MIYDNTGGSVGWCDAAILIPWRYYQRYGDREILERFYGMMKKNAMFMIKNAGPKDRKTLAGDPDQKYIYEKGMHLGEWLEPEEFQEKISAGNMPEHPEMCIRDRPEPVLAGRQKKGAIAPFSAGEDTP